MKKGYIYGIASLFMLVLWACGPNQAEKDKKQEEDLAKEILAVHDEVMPKMDELVKLRKQLKDKVNTWTETAPEQHAVNIEKATNLIQELDAADKAMMDWMHEYNGGQGLYDHKAIMEYLNEEKVKIDAVKTKFNGAVESAKIYLDNNK